MSTYLLEIGTEELPADLAESVISQLELNVNNDLNNNKIKFSEIRVTTTPRRIALIIEGIAPFSEDNVEECKGPPVSQAFCDGKPTKAAIGFAKRFDLPPEKLEIKETLKGVFVFAKLIEKGKPVVSLLADCLPGWISKIQGRRFMRWGEGDFRFSRPIRWIVSLLDSEVLPFEISGCDPEIEIGNISRPHRLCGSEFQIKDAKTYVDQLRDVGVIVDRCTRLSCVNDLVLNHELNNKFKPDLSDELLNELTDLVESPLLVHGRFDESFLDLPPEVLSTVMKVHQRYIPLYKENADFDPLALDSRNVLLPSFLCISNGLSSARENIILGNEKVLKARFSDASFFIKSDLLINSSSRINKLKNVTFAEGLGSLYDRVDRIKWLTKLLTIKLKFDQDDIEKSIKVAHFSKHDLVSNMVDEFPELQGIIGSKYLLHEGESRDVCLGVLEHYKPKGTADSLPSNNLGNVVSLAERFELLFSIFARGERPTGSSDPYALRRAANGILLILWDQGWQLNINEIIKDSLIYWKEIFPNIPFDINVLSADLIELFRQRISSLLEEKEIDSDVIQAIAGDSTPTSKLLGDSTDVDFRASLLMDMRKNNKLNLLQAVVTRASKLVAKTSISKDVIDPSDFVDKSLFEKDSELQMFNVLEKLKPLSINGDHTKYKLLADGLVSSAEILSNFFDGEGSVMVMTDNLSLRNNRLNLLSILRNQSLIIADFSKLR
ncbi:glycine--tRNA ligase subunit beta [Prochlorococcus marinus]|uniref:Glycine--tRNA ligase beta subunit n=1 Tax=Prochlorococcus marinus XMU1408 TaxID=2213228 RepID=A0A318R3X1_PROMR|nr:glycine--tRNA ligase subunit beta [Prochlorococcus marinus]MBW3041760.1 glycine--tRNA ligase subunit beta [Prochlorococcus marinus str. XMU1408]PYE02904.1 glycine--tRNA ligase subunit beta [Prochlorococcus marinus XMU1408]